MNVNILLITYIPILYYVLNNIIGFMFFIGIMIKIVMIMNSSYMIYFEMIYMVVDCYIVQL